ncbi:hypothetical protein SAMN04488077_12026 [Roseovarius tolerans]|uniref:DUF1878 family protein n=1 Tax=Roseovarius tolerans TaxID=74031 RepID=A0A1H8HFQ7_9RHOB|nr:hypothetical protein [Roseovarius tolerans]SEN55092.1 hypothetical protein SAMN04488077_12026 [Roseovarius tolerans]
MTEVEIIQAIEKLRYHVRILGESIDYDKHPVEALILGNDWGPKDLDQAHDIFEGWDKRLEKGEEMNSGSFEHAFKERLGVSYQGLKSIILAFYSNDQWTNVCEAYVDSFGKNPSVEFAMIARRER